jgi:hypothetical protein
MEKQCPHCNNKFEVANGRVFSNHVRWCPSNPAYEEIKKSTIQKISKKTIDAGKRRYALNPLKCKSCNTVIPYEDYQKDRIYCRNIICQQHARSAGHLKMAQKRKSEQKEFTCEICSKKSHKNFHSHRKICLDCKFQKNQKKKIRKENKKRKINEARLKNLDTYRRLCKFKFGIASYPQEFDFTLIEQHGWYQPANKGNNLNGVSRDHMVSVKYGFENGIDPHIIAHPANCRLIRHNDNVSKNSDCCISYEELLQRIDIWDKKYGAVDQSRSSDLHSEGCAVKCVSSIA